MPTDTRERRWLEGFLNLFPVVTAETTSTRRQQDLAALERLAERERLQGFIDRDFVRALEESSAWDYREWWPSVGNVLFEQVAIPTRFSRANIHPVERSLYAAFKNIEVVSVVLRFVCPEKFGIYSPPVASILGIVPTAKPLTTYERYRTALEKLRVRHMFDRVADVDMALWTAARPSRLARHAELRAQMHSDRHFQALVLGNLADGMNREGAWDHVHRLALAEALLRHDSMAAGALVAPVFEAHVIKLAKRCGVDAPEPREKSGLKTLITKLRRCTLVQRNRTVSLDELHQLRNRAVHNRPPLEHEEVRELIRGVMRLGEILDA